MAIASNDAKLLLNLASYAREQLHIELMKAISDQDLERVETILSIVPLGILDFINYPPDNGVGRGISIFSLYLLLSAKSFRLHSLGWRILQPLSRL